MSDQTGGADLRRSPLHDRHTALGAKMADFGGWSMPLEYAGGGIRIQLVMPGPIRTEFFSSQGMSDSVFPQTAFLTPEQLVDAALAGLTAGEAVTTPSMAQPETWDAMENARQQYLASTLSGQVAGRYCRPTEPAA